jgi:hypothetical protein
MFMTRNLDRAQRYVRLSLGGLLLAASTARMVRRPGMGAVGLGVLGGMMVAEGVLGVCPLLNMSTMRDGHCCDECNCESDIEEESMVPELHVQL